MVAIILLCCCIHVDVNTCTQLYNLLCKTFIILISSKTMSYPFSRVFSFTKIQLRPTPWRMQLEFHLRDLSFMSAEHDVKPGHSAGRSITKRHAVSNKLSRWDASVTHLISLLDTACPFVEKMLLLTAAFFIVPPFLQLIKRWQSSFQYTSFPAITYTSFFSLTFAHTDVRKH